MDDRVMRLRRLADEALETLMGEVRHPAQSVLCIESIAFSQSVSLLYVSINIGVFSSHQDCPPEQAFEGQRVGMYIEIATEAQSVYQAIYHLHMKYKDILSEYVQGVPPRIALSLSETPQPLSSPVAQRKDESTDWFDENGLKTAVEKWEELNAVEDDRGNRII